MCGLEATKLAFEPVGRCFVVSVCVCVSLAFLDILRPRIATPTENQTIRSLQLKEAIFSTQIRISSLKKHNISSESRNLLCPLVLKHD